MGFLLACRKQDHVPNMLCKVNAKRSLLQPLLRQILRAGSLFITLWRTKTTLHLMRAWRSKTQFRCIPKSWISLIDEHAITGSAAAFHRFLGLDYKQSQTDIPGEDAVTVTQLILLPHRVEARDFKGKYHHQFWHLRRNIGCLGVGWKLSALVISCLIFWR